jgi:HD-like signal output (HDOD) protein
MSSTEIKPQAHAPAGAGELHALLALRIAEGRVELPLLPAAATEALAACRSDATTPQRLADCLHRDPAITGHVLRLANSSLYGGMGSITTLTQAIHRLGFNGVAEAVMMVAVHGRFFRNPRFAGQLCRLWQHSALAAGWAREIARRTRDSVEGAFLCGLLHDLGAPVLYQAVHDIQEETGRPFANQDVETCVASLTPETGGRLLESWLLPGWVAEAVRFRPDWDGAANHPRLVSITALADLFATWSAGPRDGAIFLPAGPIGVLELGPADVEELKTRLEAVHSLADAPA